MSSVVPLYEYVKPSPSVIPVMSAAAVKPASRMPVILGAPCAGVPAPWPRMGTTPTARIAAIATPNATAAAIDVENFTRKETPSLRGSNIQKTRLTFVKRTHPHDVYQPTSKPRGLANRARGWSSRCDLRSRCNTPLFLVDEGSK